MIFVSAPYYDFDKDIIRSRVAIVSKYCGRLISEGKIAISPICLGHLVVEHCSMPNDFNYWEKYSIKVLSKCNELHVLKIKGWEESRGVSAEIKYAVRHKIKIKYIWP